MALLWLLKMTSFIEESINLADTQMAEKNPKKFYKILCQKLQPIADQRAREERQVVS